ncbi:phosphoadenosine phosphosulfate reductase family protein [Pseudidiomarina sp. 1APP75-32.1]|uniref:Phosphoadenosine phosphosulfate reductase family protein n=1 Tax=Pseudidiomarina terrestris TaxID=2820060 RepID=A0AAW7QXB3_9GAMM|nr:phosphoadenosine phosphosulfate reductase family protein [Pseudidiomarina sp. 1APP75-32.1]MDN7124865.1 phosphoadenosine phosphosulfate reductase family protein [Pseudidiomarina sp. 1APP75-32.1]
MTKKIKHVLGLSGGKDSSALALYMKETRPDLDIEYFFTDTGYELPETNEFIDQLEERLGYIHRLNAKSLNNIEGRGELDFKSMLKKHQNFLPSQRDRWCTIQLKLKPFERWADSLIADGYEIYSYVGIRADEPHRTGLLTIDKPITTVMPFREDGIVKSDIENILQRNGLELPAYYSWRSRSGCSFCFYQKKIEWVRLKDNHPELFEQAKEFEKGDSNNVVGERFYWMGKGEPLETLEDPKRREQIIANHEKQVERFKKKKRRNALIGDIEGVCELTDIDEIYDDVEGGGACITCYK